MNPPDVVVVGASAGGVEPIVALAGGLPEHFPAAICIVLHLPSNHHSRLPEIIDRAGPLPAIRAVDGAVLQAGAIYVAPPNYHLLIEGHRLRLTLGPRVNNVRPSIDVLFRSAARTFDQRVVGVILSGTLSDGALGLDAIKLRGGTVVIQDPEEARFAGMPRSAIERVNADYVLPVSEIPPLLVTLTARGEADQAPRKGDAVLMNNEIAREASNETDAAPNEKRGNAASGFTCPTCHGSLWELDDNGLHRIECRVGHAFSVEAFLGEQSIALEDALWSAINHLEERGMALRRFAGRADGLEMRAARYLTEAETVERQAELLREGLVRVIRSESSVDGVDGDS